MRSKNEAKPKATYLYDFMQAIAPLQGENVPPELGRERDMLSYGYTNRTAASAYIQDLPGEGEYFQLCSRVDTPQQLICTDVTAQVAYMERIAVEDFTVPGGKGGGSRAQLYAAIFEGVVLFDLLSTLENEHLFSVSGGIPRMREVFAKDPVTEQPNYGEHSSNPLDVAVFTAQVRFFFAKYLECAFSHIETQSLKGSGFGIFEDILNTQIFRHENESFIGWRSDVMTGVKNIPFNLFTMQLQAMIENDKASVHVLTRSRVLVENGQTVTLPVEYCEALGITYRQDVEALLVLHEDTAYVALKEARDSSGELAQIDMLQYDDLEKL